MSESVRFNRRFWGLTPGLAYLNHGSFGACPKAVLRVQENLRKSFQSNPTNFVINDLPNLWARSRKLISRQLGAESDGLVFVHNATEGVNTVLAQYPFKQGDEILVTSHGYNACHNAARVAAARTGAKVVEAWLPFPLHSEDEITAALANRLTSRTRLVLIDHITSPSGLVLPLLRLLALFKAQGVDVLVDGAHAPGQIPLNLAQIMAAGATFYTGNFHKWLCAPPGAAFLYMNRHWRSRLQPLVISHGYNAPAEKGRTRTQQLFDWTGTQDVSPVLCIPAALEFLSRHEGGLAGLMRANHAKVLAGRDLVRNALGLDIPAPDVLLGSMASLILPKKVKADRLREQLRQKYRIQTQLFHWGAINAPVLRLSAQVYNRLDEYERLAAALKKLL